MGIKFFRMGSELFPWGNKINPGDYPDFKEICDTLQTAGMIARQSQQRLTFHPGPFNLLASPKKDVVENTVKDLEMHGLIMDLMGLDQTHYNKINIHIGATYGDKKKAADTWVNNLNLLSKSVKSRLTVENDDKASMFSVKDLFHMVFVRTGVPIVFDYHHHRFNDGGLSEREALMLAMSTWGYIKPVVHYSESKSIHEENNKIRPQAHSDYIHGPINIYGKDVDVMVEAKAKDWAILKYMQNEKTNLLVDSIAI
jgi:UV DNA damage endonuclease